ncbi:MAG: alginate O-acetyltransferase AlgX-related protein, partial [Vicinamibacterales bacterium]
DGDPRDAGLQPVHLLLLLMTHADQPLPSASLSREAAARIEVGSTAVSPVVARVLVACFVTVIAGVPIVELASVRTRRAEGAATVWSHLAGVPREIGADLAGPARTDSGRWRRVVSANRIVLAGLTGFERALDDESMLGRGLRPFTQAIMAAWLGAGNERVYIGRDGWLFYRPDVEYLTGPPFLRASQLRRRIAAASEWEVPPQPDPREAIVRFHHELRTRGIMLVVMPTPLKPAVHPEMLAARYTDLTGALRNPSYGPFVEDLRHAGVVVFDLSEALAGPRRSGPQYLVTDSHWRPETMEVAAELLGEFIPANVHLPAATDPGFRLDRAEVRNTGDIARMLDLSTDATLFPSESAWVQRVLQADGSPWRPSPGADVLLMGDSFSNIYSLQSMGWGTSAGFAEQLALTLRRPVDRLVQNDQGAFATRAMLRRAPDRLNGKRVVVYQFAARELAFGDWKVLPLPAAGDRSPER